MNRFFLVLGLLSLIAACTSVPSDYDEPKAPEEVVDISQQPLKIPSLSELPDTEARPLDGRFIPVSWGALPGWSDDALDHVWKGFINNCKGLMRPVANSKAMPARATPHVWQPVCAAAKQLADNTEQPSAAQLREFFHETLQPWRLADGAGKPATNTVTGYYEPLIQGSLQRSEQYRWPLYGVPDDLLTIDLGGLYPELAGKRIRGKLDGKRVVPYKSRAQIAASEQQPPVLVWAQDPVEAFFLQIQGSGRVQLPDGKTIRLAYADHNGHPYQSIGQWLAQQNELPLAQASMQNIKAWAQQNPSRIQEMLNANPAMVFFKAESVPDSQFGPKGAYGLALLAKRAIAVDTQYVPLGAPVYLATQYPASTKPLRRLVFAQDTGAAIKGPARADFYWGFGDEAGAMAGRMKQTGEMWVLWPKGAGAPTAR